MSHRRSLSLVVVLLVLLSSLPAAAGSAAIPLIPSSGEPSLDLENEASREHLLPSSLGFVENRGQFPDEDVLFFAALPEGGIAFSQDGVLLNVVETPVAPSVPDRGPMRPGVVPRASPSIELGCTVGLTFQWANDVVPVGRSPLPGVYNYLIGDDPSGWSTGVLRYSRVVYEDLYDGIDLLFSNSLCFISA